MTRSGAARSPLVAVVGNGLLPAGHPTLALARRLGEALVSAGYRVLTGGRGGVMAAACEGARLSPRYRPGDTVGILPGHGAGQANEHVDVVVPTGLGIARNSIVAHADAVVAVGGGAGTLSEMAMAWELDRLIVAMRVDGWSGRLADGRIDGRVRLPEVVDDQVHGADTAEEAVRLLARYLPLYAPGLIGRAG